MEQTEWRMTYMGPTVEIPTDYGTVVASFTRKDHAHVSANWSRNGGDITFGGKRYEVLMHLWADLDWSERTELGDPNGPKPFRRIDDLSKVAAPTFRAKIAETISAAVRAYAEARPQMLKAAEVNHLEHELDRAQKERDVKAQAYQQAIAQVAQISRQLTGAENDEYEYKRRQDSE